MIKYILLVWLFIEGKTVRLTRTFQENEITMRSLVIEEYKSQSNFISYQLYDVTLLEFSGGL